MTAANSHRILAASAGLALSATAGAQVINENFDSTTAGSLPTGWTEGTIAGGVMIPWAVGSAVSNSIPNSVSTDDPPSVSDRFLTLPGFSSLGTVTLDFWSSYFTETTYDGWIVEVSLNGGAFTNIGDSAWTLNGYNATIDLNFGNPIAGERAFSGNFPAWTRHTASIPTGVGDSVSLRIRMASDDSVTATGVSLDDVVVTTAPPPPSGACCLANQTCTFITAAACTARNGLYYGDNTICASVSCTPVTFTPVALNCNFNGMVHGAAEQGIANRDNPDGYRSVSDRGLMVDGSAGSINGAPIIDADFMPFTVVANAAQLDIVHLGDRDEVDNGNWSWGVNANCGLQPAWLPVSSQTGPQTTDVTALNAVLTGRGSVGILYQVSNSGGRFDVQLRFTDNSSATVTLYGPDWYQNQSPPAAGAGSGLAVQRQLGVYTGTGSVDIASPDQPLNVAEAVINVASLQAAGQGNFAGKQLASITFQNPVCTSPNYPDPAVGAGFAIIAATIGGTGSAPTCYANCDHSTTNPCLNVLDFGCFLNAFAAANTYANCDNSTTPPVLNVLDFGCFLNRFAAGCSSC